MNKATATNGSDFEQALLSHVDMCYSVALALTRNPKRALALAEETLLWGRHCAQRMSCGGTMKMALLSELRERFRRERRTARKQSAFEGRQLQEAGI